MFRYRTCGADRGIEHKCSIQTISTDPGYSKAKQRKAVAPTALISYDFEITQNDSFQCSETVFLHCVNYAVAHKVCTVCMEREFGQMGKCSVCGGGVREVFDRGEETVNHFLK